MSTLVRLTELKAARTGQKLSRNCRPRRVDALGATGRETTASMELKARQRLQTLLSGVQTSERELLRQAYNELSADEQLLALARLSGTIVLASVTFSTICRVDPLGGLDVLHPSLEHCFYGLAAAVPLLLARWCCVAGDVPSFVKEVAERRTELCLAFVENFSLLETLIARAMVSIAMTLFVFPGLTGALASSAQTYFSAIFGPGLKTTAFEGSLLVVSGLLGLLEATTLCLEEEKAEVIMSAMQNSSRYYRMTSPHDPVAAQSRADVFWRVSARLLRDNERACVLGAVVTLLETFFGGMLWRITGDAAVVICLFLALNVAEAAYCKAEQTPPNM